MRLRSGALAVFIAILATSSGYCVDEFIQSGDDAVGRTAQDKMRDIVSVKDFGAVGSGDDETEEIQNAVYSGASIIDFNGTGIYYFSDVIVPSGVELRGNNCYVKLKPQSGAIGGGYHALFKASSAFDISIHGFRIDGNISGQSTDAGNIDRYASLYFVECDNIDIYNNNFMVEPYGNAAVRIRGGSNVSVIRNKFTNTSVLLNAAIFYAVTGNGEYYRVTLDENICDNCGISINDDLDQQYLYEWSVSRNKILGSNGFNQAGIGARASGGVIDGNIITGGYFGITASQGGSFSQHDLTISNNRISANSGSLNPYGIEHYANRVLITGNALINCGITTSNGTGSDCVVANNSLYTNKDTSYANPAISFSSGIYSNIEISGNIVRGFGTFFSTSRINGLTITGNTAELTYYANQSTGIKITNDSASPYSLVGLSISANKIKNAHGSWLKFDGTSGAVTVYSMRALANTLDTCGNMSLVNTTLSNSCLHSFNEYPYLTVQSTPTSAAGLVSGAVWRDTAAGNVLKIVP